MTKSRLEAFSDGVLAILITILVLELKIPHEASFESLRPVIPVFFAYVLSFIYVGIYWNNHHHMFHAATHVNGRVMWANLHLLFWLSLIPFTTGWMGENHFAAMPSAFYGIVLLMCAIAYYILQSTIIQADGPNSRLARAVGSDWKGKLSPIFYLTAIAAAFFQPMLSEALYVIVAIIWFVPDTRIERVLEK